jgi:hypothetical protein
MARDELGRPDDLDTHASRRVLGRVGLAGVAGFRVGRYLEVSRHYTRYTHAIQALETIKAGGLQTGKCMGDRLVRRANSHDRPLDHQAQAWASEAVAGCRLTQPVR